MLLSNDGFRDARVRREASALAGAGHEVTIFALASDRTVETEWVEGFRFRRIAPRRTGPALLWNVLLWPWHFAELAHAADREWSFDAVHAHDLDILEPARALAASRAVPLIYDSHELFIDSLNQGFSADCGRPRRLARSAALAWMEAIGRWAERRGYAAAAAHITTNESYREFLGRRYGPPNPVPIDNYPPRRELGESGRLRRELAIEESQKVILYQGNFTHGRGLDRLIRALPLLDSEAVVVLIGWGWIRAELEALARELAVQDRVYIVDTVPAGELPEYTAGADVGVMTTDPINLSRRYCTSNKLFEYLMAGLPVVVSDLPENRKVLDAYPAGELIGDLEPATIAGAINKVLTSKRLDEMKSLGRKAVKERYNWERERAKLIEIYADLERSP
ncbi:MAG: hypothetical protein CME06_18020 [Gemmatimonadetes bacterium]|nr:hypothetical protein [Gemmatimonadota bacterium]